MTIFARVVLVAIGSAVVISAVVGYLALRPGGFLSNGLDGTWYGQVSSEGSPSFIFEVYASLQGTRSTVSGTGEICTSSGGIQHIQSGLAIDGTADGTDFDLTIDVPDSDIQAYETGTYAVSNGTGTANGQSTDNQNGGSSAPYRWSAIFQSGDLAQFVAACKALPAPPVGVSAATASGSGVSSASGANIRFQ